MKLDYKKKKKINLKSIHFNKKGNAIDKIPTCTVTFLTFFLYFCTPLKVFLWFESKIEEKF